ncbi:MAG: redox-regulated ATPase YchF [bacterium]
MSLSIGIVGLPNVGKSTMFNALTNLQVDASAYPFCTIDPNVGVVEVPDNRIDALEEMVKPQKTVHPTVEFVDIAGLVAGASKGEGLGNKFLHNIREVDAIAHVVRFFGDQNVAHVHGKVDPQDDIKTINLELILADLELVTKKYNEVKDKSKGKSDKDILLRVDALGKIKETLEAEKLAKDSGLNEEEWASIKDLQFLTAKPVFFIANVDEDVVSSISDDELKQKLGVQEEVVGLCARLEMEISRIGTKEERKEYLQEFGLQESGLDRVIKRGYSILNLISYFTAGEKEVRAWTITQGTKAPQAAGVIHTDFERGFIKADVIRWDELIACNGWPAAREKGKVRMEGKEYIVQDGDVMLFRFNV